MTRDLTAVRQEVNNLDSSVVVQELELAMNLALYGLLWSLGKVYIKKNLGLTLTYFTARSNFVAYMFEWGKLI